MHFSPHALNDVARIYQQNREYNLEIQQHRIEKEIQTERAELASSHQLYDDNRLPDGVADFQAYATLRSLQRVDP